MQNDSEVFRQSFLQQKGEGGGGAHISSSSGLPETSLFQGEYYGSGKFGMCLNTLPVRIMDSITTQHFADFC